MRALYRHPIWSFHQPIPPSSGSRSAEIAASNATIAVFAASMASS